MVSLPIQFQKIGGRLTPILPQDFMSGLIIKRPVSAKIRVFGRVYPDGAVVEDDAIDIKTSASLSIEEALENGLVLHNHVEVLEDRTHFLAHYVWIEVSGGLIHPYNIQTHTTKEALKIETEWQKKYAWNPPQALVVQTPYRTKMATPTVTEDEEKTAISGFAFNKFTVYIVDKWGYSPFNPPKSADEIISKAREDGKDYPLLFSCTVITSYRL